MNYKTTIKLMEESELPTQDQWDAMSMFQQNYFHNNLIIEQTAKLKNNFKDENYLLDFLPKNFNKEIDTFTIVFEFPLPTSYEICDKFTFTFIYPTSQTPHNKLLGVEVNEYCDELQTTTYEKVNRGYEFEEVKKAWDDIFGKIVFDFALCDNFKWGHDVLKKTPTEEIITDEYLLYHEYWNIININLHSNLEQGNPINLEELYQGLGEIKYGNSIQKETMIPYKGLTTNLKPSKRNKL